MKPIKPDEGEGDVAARLVRAGLFDAAGEVDVAYFALRLRTDANSVSAALEAFARQGLLTATTRWRCEVCGAECESFAQECSLCSAPRPGLGLDVRVFLRPDKSPSRDPAAVFLIHGMNTLGDWQESLAWKIALIYGYPVPVFVFKFGRDRWSPLSGWSQKRRTRQLAVAVEGAQRDLASAGRNPRCDVIAHSFGTLLFARLLEDPRAEGLQFGRVVLTGSIVREDFPWDAQLATDRVEGVLNHRALLDDWVRVAPWIFPNVGATGTDGFSYDGQLSDYASSDFGHSDYFDERHFDTVVRAVWTVFLNGQKFARQSTPGETERKMPRRGARRHRYWIGRVVLLFLAVVGAAIGLLALSVAGWLSMALLARVRL